MKTFFFLLLAFSVFFLSCDDGSDDDNDDNDDNNDDSQSGDDDSLPGDDDDDSGDDDSGDDDNDDSGDDDDDNDDNDDETPPDNAVYVDGASGDDANPGTADLPKQTFNAALTLANAEVRPIVIAEGVYEEESFSQVISTSVYGGYRASDWQRNITVHETILRPLWPLGWTMTNPHESEIRLDGLTIIGPTAEESGQAESIGISIQDGKIRLTRCRISGGDVVAEYDAQSIGIMVYRSANVVFENNEIDTGEVSAQSGKAYTCGILFGSEGNAGEGVVRGNRINAGPATNETSTAWSAGVAYSVWDFPLLMVNNDIVGGEADGGFASLSHGVEVYYGDGMTLVNNRLAPGNCVGGSANAIRTFDQVSTVTLIGNLLTTAASDLGGGAYLQGNAILINNIIYAAEDDFTYALRTLYGTHTLVANDLKCGTTPCFLLWANAGPVLSIDGVNACGWEGCDLSTGNFAAEPEFDSAAYPHLLAGSPCIDAGVDPGTWYDGADAYLDMDGDARPQGAAFDVGPDEWHD
ncbi:MAG: hypothetical protein GX444_17790 [Myxococcales bacterium]|nr:hypothetical protein [Myxococcales bacterium]